MARILIALLFMSCAGLTGVAQSSDKAAVKAVLKKEDARVKALLSGDSGALKSVYANDYSLVTEDGSVQTKLFRLGAVTSGVLKFEKIEIVERDIRTYGDTVVILAREKLTIKRDGKPVGGDLRLTRVYKKMGKDWYLIASHATAIRP